MNWDFLDLGWAGWGILAVVFVLTQWHARRKRARSPVPVVRVLRPASNVFRNLIVLGVVVESYDIDPSELHRVFPPVSVLEAKNDNKIRADIPNDIMMLQLELKVRDEKIALIEAEREREREQLTGQIDDLRQRLDAEAEERRKLTALLTDQSRKPAAPAAEPEPPCKGFRAFLHRLTG
jgi:hypothetical protein